MATSVTSCVDNYNCGEHFLAIPMRLQLTVATAVTTVSG